MNEGPKGPDVNDSNSESKKSKPKAEVIQISDYRKSPIVNDEGLGRMEDYFGKEPQIMTREEILDAAKEVVAKYKDNRSQLEEYKKSRNRFLTTSKNLPEILSDKDLEIEMNIEEKKYLEAMKALSEKELIELIQIHLSKPEHFAPLYILAVSEELIRRENEKNK